jgi:formylglycine-generating enzyme required for sulfatase activity
MEFVWVPPDCFQMGSPTYEPGRDSDEGPVHEVCVDEGFWMGRYEVTNAQYHRWSQAHASGDYKGHPLNRADQPVVKVSWYEARQFTEWLTAEAGTSGWTYRLPTEAEWEYAARAGTTTSRFWGDNPDDACVYANVYDQTSGAAFAALGWNWPARNCNDGYAAASPVGQFRPNRFGLYDMLGNVWEWVADTYYDSYEGAPSNGTMRGDLGDRKKKVQRGGSWDNAAQYWRSASRIGRNPDDEEYNRLGFRVVVSTKTLD